jgi:hypothetical protein
MPMFLSKISRAYHGVGWNIVGYFENNISIINKTQVAFILYACLLYFIISLPCCLVKVDGMERNMNKQNAINSRTKPSQNLGDILSHCYYISLRLLFSFYLILNYHELMGRRIWVRNGQQRVFLGEWSAEIMQNILQGIIIWIGTSSGLKPEMNLKFVQRCSVSYSDTHAAMRLGHVICHLDIVVKFW